MRVKISVVAARVGLMQCDIGDHAGVDESELHKSVHQLPARLSAQLVGQRQFDITGELRILPLLCGLHSVPQLHSIMHPGRRTGRRENRALDHALAAAIIEGETGALICDQLAGTISRRGRHRAPFGTPHNVSR